MKMKYIDFNLWFADFRHSSYICCYAIIFWAQNTVIHTDEASKRYIFYVGYIWNKRIKLTIVCFKAFKIISANLLKIMNCNWSKILTLLRARELHLSDITTTVHRVPQYRAWYYSMYRVLLCVQYII